MNQRNIFINFFLTEGFKNEKNHFNLNLLTMERTMTI